MHVCVQHVCIIAILLQFAVLPLYVEQSPQMRSTSVSLEIRLVALDTMYSVYECDCVINKRKGKEGSIRGEGGRRGEREGKREREGGRERGGGREGERERKSEREREMFFLPTGGCQGED